MQPINAYTTRHKQRHNTSVFQCIFGWIFSSSVLQQISSNGRYPLPLECHGLVDQISRLACRQWVLEMDFSRQSVPIEKCTWKERIFVDISLCRDGDETCVISVACLTRRLRQTAWDRWQSDHLLLWRKVIDVPLCICQTARASQVHQATWSLKSRYRTYSTLKPGYGTVLLFTWR